MSFHPDDPAAPGSGIFGLPNGPDDARVHLLPVPFDATTSYHGGTADGPEAIRRASAQVDLYDLRFGRVYEQGIWMAPAPAEVLSLRDGARPAAQEIIGRGGAAATDAEAVRMVDAAGARVNDLVHRAAGAALAAGRVPGVIGGDHSTPFGAIRACAEATPAGLGILHVDAHMDLRPAYEGFRWSHASIMHNVLADLPGVTRLVQVGIRDFSEGELAAAGGHGPRVAVFFDADIEDAADRGTPFAALAAEVVSLLPDRVYVSFDIDGLSPELCPNTGTPVPGGLSFRRAMTLLDVLWKSGRSVAGFDLVEVAPGPGERDWDANVGARVLYALCGCCQRRAT